MERTAPRPASRSVFAEAARAALVKLVPEARTGAASWHIGPGSVWVGWSHTDGRWVAFGLRRHLDWVTGEVALAEAKLDPETLPLWIGEGEPPDMTGLRVRLGVLLDEEDRWWPAGSDARALAAQLESIVLQLRVKAETRVLRPRRPEER